MEKKKESQICLSSLFFLSPFSRAYLLGEYYNPYYYNPYILYIIHTYSLLYIWSKKYPRVEFHLQLEGMLSSDLVREGTCNMSKMYHCINL